MESATPWTIGRLAKAASVPIDTIRYYEREGLLKPAFRRPSGYRIYTEKSLEQLSFIRRAQTLGFTLREIRELLLFSYTDHDSCIHVRDKLRQKLAEIEFKLKDLLSIRTRVRADFSLCEKKLKSARTHAPDRCPVLKQLASLPGKEPLAGGPKLAKSMH